MVSPAMLYPNSSSSASSSKPQCKFPVSLFSNEQFVFEELISEEVNMAPLVESLCMILTIHSRYLDSEVLALGLPSENELLSSPWISVVVEASMMLLHLGKQDESL
jgi:hypothetical protein